MNYQSSRNERKSRSYALVLAIGLHLSLGGLLYFQMSETSPSQVEKDVKVNVTNDKATPAAQTVSTRPKV